MSDSDLPQGWSWIPLGELIQPVMTRDPAQEPNLEFTYFDISSIDNELGVVTNPKRVLGHNAPSRARRVVEAGDVLFSTVRPYLRGIAQVPITENGVASTGFCVLRPENSISAKYLYYLVRSDGFLDGLLPLQRGASYPAVREVDVLTQLAPVAPIAEQKRIVEKLDELLSDLDAGVAELKAAQKKLSQYRQSLLNDAVEGLLTTEWRAERALHGEAIESGMQLLTRILTERRARWEAKQLAKFKEQGKIPSKNWQDKYPEPVQPDITDLPTLPGGWVWATLSQVGWLDRGRSKHRPRNAPHLYGGAYPFVQTGDIRDADTFINRASSNYSEAGLAQSKLWPINTLCITIAANIGKTAILGIEACFPDSVVGFLPASDNVSVRFVEYFMRTAQQMLEAEAPATAQKNINLEILEHVCLPLPPLDEQLQIVSIVSAALNGAVQQNDSIELNLKQTAAQRNNICKAAFSGQLVLQDPNDEPASMLLERISAERKERERQPKPRKIKIKKEISAMGTKLKDVLAEAADWMPAQEAFRRCGVADSAHTDQVEALYAELRELDKSNQLAVESVKDAQGCKLYDQLKFIVTT